MTAKKRYRTVKSVSFADDEYEQGLFEFATDPARGAFAAYVKRLIERDRDGWVRVEAVLPTVVKSDVDEEKRKKLREAAKGFM